jgi:phospholipid/cholesterol/gamma-HCH transport system substrate-binding protein
MGRKNSSFLIGLFVVTGVLLGMVAVVWLGVSRYFREGTHYVTYFDESVQGLSPDTPVKYRGVAVGHVESIAVAPDTRLVEVVMQIDLKVGQENAVVAQLKSAGLTGIAFVELDQAGPGETALRPALDFTPPYPVIPSRLSAMKDMMAELDEILDQVSAVDFLGIADRTKALLDNAGKVLTDGKVERLLTDAGGMMNEGRGLLVETRGEVSRMRLGERVDRTADGLDTLLAQLRAELEAMQLAETTARARRSAEELDQMTRRVGIEMRDTTAELRLVLETLDRLLERLNASPSDLIFSRHQPLASPLAPLPTAAPATEESRP